MPFGKDTANMIVEFSQDIHGDRPLAIPRDIYHQSIVSKFNQCMVHESTVLLIEEHLLQVWREKSLVLSPSRGRGGIDRSTV